MTNMKNHEQFNIPKPSLPVNISERGQRDFESSPSILRTDKTLNIKDFYSFNDQEFRNSKGQRFSRTPFTVSAVNAVYSVAAQDFLIGIPSLVFAPSIGLPLPSFTGPNKHYIVKDEAGGAATTTITITSEGEKNIDGASSATITTNYGAKEFYTDGANWFTK